jgi:peptidoglycan/LPS O-acetylase OafA/YrhL
LEGRLGGGVLRSISGLGAFLLVSMVALDGKTLFHAVLNSGIVRFYGKISYSFYLLHFPVMHALASLTLNRIPVQWIRLHPVVASFYIAVASVLVVTPLSYLSWRFIEVPGIELSKRLFGRRKKMVEVNAPSLAPV